MNRKIRTPRLAIALALALAGAISPAAPARRDAAPARAAAPAAQPAPTPGREMHLTFTQLGQRGPVTIKRGKPRMKLPFALRSDELVTQATLHLDLTHSPMLAGRVGALEVRLNGEPVTRIDVPASGAPPQQALGQDIEIDPRLIADQNELTVQFTDPVTCADPASSGLWAQIGASSSLALRLSPLALSDELSVLPAPFFDRNDIRRPELTLVLSPQAGNATLQAAGTLVSWFGALASYRGLQVTTRDRLPPGHAIVLATGQDRPAGIELPPIAGATVTLAPHPEHPDRKVLYVLGRDATELRRAADALVLGQLPGHGSTALIERLSEPAPRQPYDAPNWTPTHRPVRFDELVPVRALVAAGVRPDTVELPMRLPPDLFPWRHRQVPIDLRLRHTSRSNREAVSLKVMFNGEVIREEEMTPSQPVRWLDRLQQQVWGDGSDTLTRTLRRPMRLPVAQLGTQSHARLALDLRHGDGEDDDCPVTTLAGADAGLGGDTGGGDGLADVPRTVIDGASTIDFSGAPHFLPMPNLAAFANAGHPYTRHADLAQAAVVLPASPLREEIDAYLSVMARMGEATGLAARRVAVVHAREVGEVADRDLVVIGSAGNQALFAEWARAMPFRDGATAAEPAASDALPDWLRGLGSLWQRRHHPPLEPLSFRSTGAQAALVGFESPLRAGRSVVALMGATPGALDRLADALREPSRLSQLHGHVAVIDENDRITSHRADPTYTSGDLPWLAWLRWQLSDKPILLWLVMLGSIAALSMVMYVLLRRHALRRHAGASV